MTTTKKRRLIDLPIVDSQRDQKTTKRRLIDLPIVDSQRDHHKEQNFWQLERICRDVSRAYNDCYGPYESQVSSFNNAIDQHITGPSSVILESECLEVPNDDGSMRFVFRFGNITVPSPTTTEADGTITNLTPDYAMKAKRTYASPVLADITQEIQEWNPQTQRYQLSYNRVDGSPLRREFREVTLFELPVMIGSKICHWSYDLQSLSRSPANMIGVFIIGGHEKRVISQFTTQQNYPHIYTTKPPATKYCLVAEVRSLHEKKIRSTSTVYLSLTDIRNGQLPDVQIKLPFVHGTAPSLHTIFLLLNVTSVDRMLWYIVGSEEPRGSALYDLAHTCLVSNQVFTSEQSAAEKLGAEHCPAKSLDVQIQAMRSLIANEYLPHMGLDRQPPTMEAKAFYTGFVVRELLSTYLGLRDTDKKDDPARKSVQCTGTLIGLLVRQLWRKSHRTLRNDCKQAIRSKKYLEIPDYISPRQITTNLNFSIATGKWGIQKGGSTQIGYSQAVNRKNEMATLSQGRMINIPINREGKMMEPRQLYHKCYGMLCPVETPDGKTCGLLNMLTIHTHIRHGHTALWILELLASEEFASLWRPLTSFAEDLPQKLESLPQNPSEKKRKIFINGTLVGFTWDGQVLVERLREARCYRRIAYDTSVSLFHDRCIILCDSGALCRPVFCLERIDALEPLWLMYSDNSVLFLNKLMEAGVLLWIDLTEQENYVIAPSLQQALGVSRIPGTIRSHRIDSSEYSPSTSFHSHHSHGKSMSKYTHSEIHSSSLLGICTNAIPFPDHNQSPRNTYQTCMAKQSVSLPYANPFDREDTQMHMLNYVQTPLVQTHLDQISDAALYSGVNCFVAFISGLHNQEDSLILSKSFVERGGCLSSFYRSFRDEEHSTGSERETFQNPLTDPECATLIQHWTEEERWHYRHLDDDGCARIGSIVEHGDVLIAKVVQTPDVRAGGRDDYIRKEHTVRHKAEFSATVDRAQMSATKEGARMMTIVLFSLRFCRQGDKFSSRHGQKGVVGRVESSENLPYVMGGPMAGLVPDCIFNPHCIPRRMTIGKQIEMVAGKLGCSLGDFIDGTAFQGETPEEIFASLHSHGFQRYGDEILCAGDTGEMMECPIFLGTVYMQRLNHMVDDKIHARNKGPRNIITQQPVEGRARDGGIRFGEMERDNLIAYGAPEVLKDRLCDSSDGREVYFCTQCGMIAETKALNYSVSFTLHGKNDEYHWHCSLCDTDKFLVRRIVPNSYKLFVEEMKSTSIATIHTLKS
jgi:DNA-directed RNA polymerase II subunit RPB2